MKKVFKRKNLGNAMKISYKKNSDKSMRDLVIDDKKKETCTEPFKLKNYIWIEMNFLMRINQEGRK